MRSGCYGVVTYEGSHIAALASLKRCSLDNATTYVHLPLSHFVTDANAVFLSLSPSDIIHLGALVCFVLAGTYFLLAFPFCELILRLAYAFICLYHRCDLSFDSCGTAGEHSRPSPTSIAPLGSMLIEGRENRTLVDST